MPVVCIVGALASAALAAYAGRHNASRLLVAIFCGWTVAPLLLAAWATSAARTASIRETRNVIALLVAAGSLAVYSLAAFGYIDVKLGFIFLVTPALSLLVIGILVLVTAFVAGRAGGS